MHCICNTLKTELFFGYLLFLSVASQARIETPERKCCGQHPDSCISMLPHMDLYILSEGVLRFARRIWNDIRGRCSRSRREQPSGALGHGRRVFIPSCCVWRIQQCNHQCIVNIKSLFISNNYLIVFF